MYQYVWTKTQSKFFAFSELASTQAAQKIFNNSWIQCFPDGEISSLWKQGKKVENIWSWCLQSLLFGHAGASDTHPKKNVCHLAWDLSETYKLYWVSIDPYELFIWFSTDYTVQKFVNSVWILVWLLITSSIQSGNFEIVHLCISQLDDSVNYTSFRPPLLDILPQPDWREKKRT